jgi:hypothetical protein
MKRTHSCPQTENLAEVLKFFKKGNEEIYISLCQRTLGTLSVRKVAALWVSFLGMSK